MESNEAGSIRRTGIIFLLLCILFLGVRMSSCSAPKTAPLAQVVEMPTESLQQGRVLFNEYCASCHPGGMAGVGLAIINKPLPEDVIEFQIRNGIGVMPAFNDKMLSDEEVENIAEYLVYLRKGKKGEKVEH
ncbi:c-type cytochrome [Salinimicrobium terrae]|uniref:c-type cytochrome n=1 Tax=Salinimicrobium terrae TaxID=470866 RepID=UPI0009FC2F42|nr:cytochrome c [Salinimicrobium terrae]